jgi:hypothetical protein
MYSIAPCPVITTKTITSFKIDRIEISLFKSAIITVILLDSAGSIIDVKFLNMTGEDYSKWDANDAYVIEFIKRSLEFSDVVPTVVDTSVVDTSAVDTSVVDTSVVDTSAVDTSAVDTSATE